MAEVALRTRALSLYRSLMRSCRTWPGPPKEKQYIYEEATVLFRKDQHLTEPEEIAKKIEEGEKRYQIAWVALQDSISTRRQLSSGILSRKASNRVPDSIARNGQFG